MNTTAADAAAIASLAAALADPTRMRCCLALLDGRAWTCGELARHVGVAPSTASEHLTRLVDVGLLTEERQGRHRYLRLADDQVATILEDLTSRQPPAVHPVRSLRAARVDRDLSFARTCYDHLAGRLGVEVYLAMTTERLLDDTAGVVLTPSGRVWLLGIGGHRLADSASRRPQARACLDWTERRSHLAGTSGAALLDAMLARNWVERRPGERSLRVTPTGSDELRAELGIDVARLRRDEPGSRRSA